jgi:hypothetical protein
MAFDTPNAANSQQMRAIAAAMSKKSHGTMSHGYDPELGTDVDGGVGGGGGPLGSLKTPNPHPLPKPTQGKGGMRIK